MYIYRIAENLVVKIFWQNVPQQVFGDFKFAELKKLTDHTPCGVFYITCCYTCQIVVVRG